ncbi:MAG: hypothetical protein KGL39_05750 [Patescibacteria group bacterium]|nr:hypothetical protein [Patescibacteria group bacterium]
MNAQAWVIRAGNRPLGVHTVRALKRYRCEECGEVIEAGQSHAEALARGATRKRFCSAHVTDQNPIDRPEFRRCWVETNGGRIVAVRVVISRGEYDCDVCAERIRRDAFYASGPQVPGTHRRYRFCLGHLTQQKPETTAKRTKAIARVAPVEHVKRFEVTVPLEIFERLEPVAARRRLTMRGYVAHVLTSIAERIAEREEERREAERARFDDLRRRGLIVDVPAAGV